MREFAGNRILMLLENNPYSQDIRVKREAHALVKAGYQVTVACPKRHSGDKMHVATEGGVHLYQYPYPGGGGGLISYLWEYGYSTLMMFIMSLIIWGREGFDIIHTHNPPDIMFPIAIFYKLFGKKFVFDHHDLSPEMYCARYGNRCNKHLYNLLVLFEKLTCRLANHVIATNESYKAMEMTRGNVPGERITIVRNGPDTKTMQLTAPDPMLQAKASTILGYVGIMGPQDGLDYLLRAIHNLVYKLNRPDIFCMIIGKGDAIPELKQLAASLKVDEHVWFTGWISDEDLIRYLSTVDICLDPDPSNPFNDRCTMIKMMEYMVLGKPIVAFDLPEHRFTAQEAAVYAHENDELDFAEKIAELMDDPARRQRMGEIGLNRIETKLAWAYQEKQLLSAYEQIKNTS